MQSVPKKQILVVDDEREVLDGARFTLERAGFNNIKTCRESSRVMALLTEQPASLVMLDIAMPQPDGQTLLGQISTEFPDLPVIMVTATNHVDTAVACMRSGAFDYLVKPVESERLLGAVKRAVELGEIKDEYAEFRSRVLSSELRHQEAFANIITNSPKMFSLFQYLETIATTSRPVLITGETGVGKELMARAIHRLSCVSGKLMTVNVAGLDDNVFSDTLFGHLKGAFTGASERREGLVCKASEGTLFLDEFGDLSPQSQVKLLRLLQEREYLPLGADVPKLSTARLVVATNRSIEELRLDPNFRKDLYHRLQTHHVHVPPLRERPEDLSLLTEHFIDEAAKTVGRGAPVPPEELQTVLANYSFPGNVRELESMIFDAVSRQTTPILSLKDFTEYIEKNRKSDKRAIPSQKTVDAASEKQTIFSKLDELPNLKEVQKLLIQEAMIRADGKQTIAARLLGISQPGLSKALKRIEEG